MAIIPYPGEDPIAFERRRQAQAGTVTPAVYSPYAPLREQPKPWVDPAPAAQPAMDPATASRLFGGQYGTTAATATWAPYATGGRAGQGDAVPDRFTPTIAPTDHSGWQSSGATMPQGEMGRLLQSGGIKYDPNFAANAPATDRPADPTQYGRLTRTQGLKYDPKLTGGMTMAGYDDAGATGYGAPNPGQGVVGAGGVNLNEDYRKNADARRMALFRRLGINPTGRGWLASYRREQVPDLYEALYATTGIDGRPQDPLAVMDDFGRMYRGGDFAGQFRQRGQALLRNRDLLDDMPLGEAADYLKGASQMAAYGMNPAIARSRLRNVEDAVAQYQAAEVAAAEEGRAPEAGFFEFLFSPAGALWARRLGLA